MVLKTISPGCGLQDAVFTSSVSHGVSHSIPWLCSMGISGAFFLSEIHLYIYIHSVHCFTATDISELIKANCDSDEKQFFIPLQP